MIVSKQSSTTFSDKSQIWADNAASSPFFGNVYMCWASFRSQELGLVAPAPLIVATSTDGGSTWRTKQVTNASNTPFNAKQGFGRSGCASTSGGYWYHQRRIDPHPAVHDTGFQGHLLDELARFTATSLP